MRFKEIFNYFALFSSLICVSLATATEAYHEKTSEEQNSEADDRFYGYARHPYDNQLVTMLKQLIDGNQTDDKTDYLNLNIGGEVYQIGNAEQNAASVRKGKNNANKNSVLELDYNNVVNRDTEYYHNDNQSTVYSNNNNNNNNQQAVNAAINQPQEIYYRPPPVTRLLIDSNNKINHENFQTYSAQQSIVNHRENNDALSQSIPPQQSTIPHPSPFSQTTSELSNSQIPQAIPYFYSQPQQTEANFLQQQLSNFIPRIPQKYLTTLEEQRKIFETQKQKHMQQLSSYSHQFGDNWKSILLSNAAVFGGYTDTSKVQLTEEEQRKQNLNVSYQKPISSSVQSFEQKPEVITKPKPGNNYAKYNFAINQTGKDYNVEVTPDHKKVKVFRLIPKASVEEIPLPSTLEYTRRPEDDFIISKVEDVPLPPPDVAKGIDRHENIEYEPPPPPPPPQHNSYVQPKSVHISYSPEHADYDSTHPYVPPGYSREQITLDVPEQLTLYPKHPPPPYDHNNPVNLPKIELIDLGQHEPVNYPEYKKPDYYLQNVKEISLDLPIKGPPEPIYDLPPNQFTYDKEPEPDYKPYKNDYHHKDEEPEEKVIEFFSDFSLENSGNTKVSNIDIKIHNDGDHSKKYEPPHEPHSSYHHPPLPPPPPPPPKSIYPPYDPSEHNTKHEYDEITVQKSIHSANKPSYDQHSPQYHPQPHHYHYPHPPHTNKPQYVANNPHQYHQHPPPPLKYERVPVLYSHNYQPPPYTDHSHKSRVNARYPVTRPHHHHRQKDRVHESHDKPCPYNHPEMFIPQLKPHSGDAFPANLDEYYRPHNHYQVAKDYPTNIGSDPDDPLKEFWRYFTDLSCDEKKIQIINFMCKSGDCKSHLFKTDSRQYTGKYPKDPNEWQSVFDLYDNPSSSSEISYKDFVPQLITDSKLNKNINRNTNSNSFNCNGKRNAYYPDVHNNCEVYYKCVNQKVDEKLKCPNGMKFNQLMQRCERAQQIRCGGNQ